MNKNMAKLQTLLQEESYPGVEQLARKIIKSSPENGLAWKALSTALKAQGNRAQSLAPLQKAAELLPDDAETRFDLAVNYRELGRLEDAVDSYRRVLELIPESAPVHTNLGVALVDLRRLDEAEASFRRAVEIEPDRADAHINLGNVLNGQRRLIEAEASYRSALRLDPENESARRLLARAWRTTTWATR